MRHAVIMAGGAGTRLWPVSRKALPKQLVPLVGGRSLLEIAAGRLDGLTDPQQRYICTAEAHRGLIRTMLPEFSDAQILGEPAGRDTANAVAFVAAVLQTLDPDAIFAVFTADHLIEPEDVFRDRVRIGFELVEEDPTRLVTFSVKPTEPATGFGYVQRGNEPLQTSVAGAAGAAHAVARFVEKPDLATAEQYLASGEFGWNAGMFVWKASTVLEALRRFKPESYEGAMRIAAAWGTPEQQRTLESVYPSLPKTSIDYAVMEPSSTDTSGDFNVCTVTLDIEWKDVGSWSNLAETIDADSEGNRQGGTGAVSLLDCKDTLVFNGTPGRLVAAIGLDGFTIVQTEDATLVMPSSEAQRIKDLHATLPDELR